jgi:hypothetical protein
VKLIPFTSIGSPVTYSLAESGLRFAQGNISLFLGLGDGIETWKKILAS